MMVEIYLLLLVIEVGILGIATVVVLNEIGKMLGDIWEELETLTDPH